MQFRNNLGETIFKQPIKLQELTEKLLTLDPYLKISDIPMDILEQSPDGEMF